MRIRARLALLVLVCVLPPWIVVGALVLHSYQGKRDLVARHITETARLLALAVDQKLTNIQSTLKVLATSHDLSGGDFATFHQRALAVLRDYPEADIIMADLSGQQVINTYRRFGETLPKRTISAVVRHVFETGEVAISGLFRGAVTRRPLISIDMPVWIDGKVAYDLAMTLPAERIAEMLIRQHLPETWLAGILDRNGIVIARTLRPETTVGLLAPAPLVARIAAAAEGVLDMPTFEGVHETIAFSRLTDSGWTVAVGVPTVTLLADARRWLLWALVGAALLSLAGVGAAALVARRIEWSIRALVPPALALGHSDSVIIGSLGIRESDEVGQALVEASAVLRQRAEERDRAERDLRQNRDELRDAIGRLQALNDELGKAKVAAEAASVAKSVFIATMSHELRTPLTSIIGFSEILRDELAGAAGDTAFQDYVEDILGNGRQLNALINDIFDLAKIESGRMEIAPIPIKAVSMVRSIVHRRHGDAAKRNISLSEEFGTGLGVLWADERALGQILTNLLSNAIKFTPPGGRVVVGLQRGVDDGIDLTVSDTGIGIPVHRLEDVMMPFERIDNRYNRATGGTGLGLSLVKGLIDLHKGTIVIGSVLGMGTQVTVHFPPHDNRET